VHHRNLIVLAWVWGSIADATRATVPCAYKSRFV
jgi:hypothetical protein